MNLDETVRLQALKLKQLHTKGTSAEVDLVDLFANDPAHAEEMKKATRNICAHINVDLFNEIEGFCQTFSMSKRQFVELALIEAMAKASQVVDEVAPFPGEDA